MKKLLFLLAFLNTNVRAESFTDDNGNVHGLGLLMDTKATGKVYYSPGKILSLPSKYDSRESGQVSAIKNQGSCGSCWSFAITKALEGARLKAGLPEVDLGEQEMVSCAKDAYGCSGGFMTSADYVVKRGLSAESDYPYTATSSRCKSPLPPVLDKGVSWAFIGQEGRKPTTEELKAAIVQYGTIFVTVAAGGSDWGGSRVHMTGCGNRGTNHMVTLVGYNEQDEFIIGNSWGKDWAENGFAYAKQGCNALAGEEDSAAFVVYEGGPAPVPPKVSLPSDIYTKLETKMPIGVESQAGVTYDWYSGEEKIGSGALIWVNPSKDTKYKLVAKNTKGTAESSVMVHLDEAPKPPSPGPYPIKECWQNYDEFAFCIGTKAVPGCLLRYDVLNKCIN
jgi:hypothetical protein